jgi:hypothetical protein
MLDNTFIHLFITNEAESASPASIQVAKGRVRAQARLRPRVSNDEVELFTSYTHAGSCCPCQRQESKNPPCFPQEKSHLPTRKKVSFVSNKFLTHPRRLNPWDSPMEGGGECSGWDSNPHSLRNQILSLARLPISPPELARWAAGRSAKRTAAYAQCSVHRP